MVVDLLADDAADRVFQALADATRRDILRRTATEEYSVSALARAYEMSLTAVQKHVTVLQKAGLVTKQRRGREQIVHANRATLGRAIELLDHYEQLWVQRATQIADLLAQRQQGDPMTGIDVTKDPQALTMTMVAQFDASPEQVWEVWEDPRLLERWWGPPSWPATFTRHEFTPGGESRYHMTGPQGETPRGWWRIDALDQPRRIAFANGLAGENGEPEPGVEPMGGEVLFEAVDGGTRMTAITRFTDVAQMEQNLAMGMEQGMAGAIGQIPEVLRAAAAV